MSGDHWMAAVMMAASCIGIGGAIESCQTGPEEVCEALGAKLLTRVPGGDYHGGRIVCDRSGQKLLVTIESVRLEVTR